MHIARVFSPEDDLSVQAVWLACLSDSRTAPLPSLICAFLCQQRARASCCHESFY